MCACLCIITLKCMLVCVGGYWCVCVYLLVCLRVRGFVCVRVLTGWSNDLFNGHLMTSLELVRMPLTLMCECLANCRLLHHHPQHHHPHHHHFTIIIIPINLLSTFNYLTRSDCCVFDLADQFVEHHTFFTQPFKTQTQSPLFD